MEDIFLKFTSTYGTFREIPSKTKITGTEPGKFYRASPTSTTETLTTKQETDDFENLLGILPKLGF